MKINSFEFSECETSGFVKDSPFYISEQATPLAVLFRVFAGTCEITSMNTIESVSLCTNYFYSDFRQNDLSNLDFLNDFEEGLEFIDYEECVHKNSYRNIDFHRTFLAEIAGCIFNLEKGKNTVAFVHLYRAYEHLAYAFPMIFASKTKDYVGSFDSLKKWMTKEGNGNAGELKFLKSFISTLFEKDEILSTAIDIRITANDEHKMLMFNALAKKVMDWQSIEKYSPGTTSPDILSIPFIEYHSFIINLRNRFFHYFNQRGDNLSIDDVIDSDLLFSMVNKSSLYFVAIIFHEISRPR